MGIAVRILLLIFIIKYLGYDHCGDCRPHGTSDTEIFVNNTGNHVNKRNYWYNSKMPICGLQKVVFTYTKRQTNDSKDTLDDDEEDDSLNKILGGSFTTYGEFPWMVSIKYRGIHVCGGAIISEYWVISAAHCFYDYLVNKFTIVVGDYSLRKPDAYEAVHKIRNVVIPDQYRRGHNDFDITMLKIQYDKGGRGIKFNNYVQPICLANDWEDPAIGTKMVFTGWGDTTFASDQASNILKKTILPIIDVDKCTDVYQNDISTNMFCAGYVDGDTDLCRGDTGGPGAFRKDDSFILYGVAVMMSGCPEPNNPAIFSSIPRYRDWIDIVLQGHSNSTFEATLPQRNFVIDVVSLKD